MAAGGFKPGDTIVETMFSFAVFSLVVVAALTLVNQGVAMAQRSLEITLVRQQIDSQVSMVQQAQQNDSQAWQDLKAGVVDNPGEFGSAEACPSPAAPAGAKFLGVDAASKQVTVYRADDSSSYRPAPSFARVDVRGEGSGNSPKAYGLWMVLAKSEKNSQSIAYDLHVRACWDAIGMTRPMSIGTVVRLYGIN